MSIRNSPVRVRAGTIIRKQGNILLVKSAKGPFKGKWGVPAGGINEYEPIEETAKREAKEETGLDVKITELYLVTEVRVKKCNDCGEKHHGITFYFNAEPLTDKISFQEEEIEEVKWVPEDEVMNYTLHPGVELFLQGEFSEKTKIISRET